MKTNYKVVAKLLATVIWSNEVFDEVEREVVGEVAEALEYDEKALIKAVEQELTALKKKNEEAVGEYLSAAAEEVNEEEVPVVLQAIIQVIVADGTLSLDEVELLHTITEALGLSPAIATLFVADMVKTEPELEVEI